ncbi:DUF5107 domain-containing protein [Gemmatimonadota bacterium]
MKTRLIHITMFALLAVVWTASCQQPVSGQQSTIREERRMIMTYPFSDPDPVPIFVRNPAIYPYFSFNGYRQDGTPQEWTVVTLENEFVEVQILPEVGGKVFGAIDKTTGEEFVYLNDVIKFRQIAMRGPWTSGGSEFNFGLVGHAPTTATPVDYLLRENDDGSVSCFVGTLDLASRTRWTMEVRLPAGQALFELRSLYSNPTPLSQSYYVWTNNAVRASDELQYFYPGTMRMPHGYTATPASWPVDAVGRDLSWYRNNAFGGSKSHFVLGEYSDFYGGYWHDTDFGFGHWALYDDMPGKKMWIWAISRQGAIWEDLLTDTHGQYSEPQAGRYFSQDDHEFLAPLSADAWTEMLFPFHGTGGMVKASPHAVLNVEQEADRLILKICPLQPLDDDLVVSIGGAEVHREHLVAGTMELFSRGLEIDDLTGFIGVEIEGKLGWTSDPDADRLTRPIDFHPPDESTAEGLYLAGESHEKRRRYDQAMERYLACVEKEPQHVRALTRIAELHLRRAEYEDALKYAGRALSLVMYDPAANYIYGVVARQLGRLVDAKETLGWAARSLEYRSNAYSQLSEICFLEGDLSLALTYADRAREANSLNIRAMELQAIIHRYLRDPDQAGKIVEDLLEIDPLNHLARFEQYALDQTAEKIDRFISMIRSELPHEHFLELAISYQRLGLDAEAITILKEAPEHPIIHYWLAWIFSNVELGAATSDIRIELAEDADPELVFPFRAETIPVLEWAAGHRSSSWKPHYYLGLIYQGMGRDAEATEQFDLCGDPDFVPFHLMLGSLKPEEGVSRFTRSVEIDGSDWRSWHYLISEYRRLGRAEEALERAVVAADRFRNRLEISMDHAGALFDSGRYADCLSILNTLVVLPYEGGWEAHNLFMRTQVMLALEEIEAGDHRSAVRHLQGSKEYPERLGTGEPYDTDFRMQDYLEWVAWERAGNDRRGQEALQRAVDYTLEHRAATGSHHLFGLLALRAAGESGESERLLEELKQRFGSSIDVRWAIAVFTGDTVEAERLAERRVTNTRFGIQIEAARVIRP